MLNLPIKLNRNQLKVIGLILMTIDHIGLIFFPRIRILRIIGRLAFPIFAYMIAEGCKYTSNRKIYLLRMLLIALISGLVVFVFNHSLYQGIFLTFSIAIIIIYLIDYANKKNKWYFYLLSILVILFAYYLCEILPPKLINTDFDIDYGFYGIMSVVLVYLCNDYYSKLIGLGFGLTTIFLNSSSNIQIYSLLSLILLSMYDGKKGNYSLKYLFYIYYPLHLAIFYLIKSLI